MKRAMVVAAILAGSLGAAGPGSTELTVGRLQYDGGGDWYANPSSLANLLVAANERTALRFAPRERVVQLTSPDLWDVPYLYLTGHGNIRFTDEEVRILRRYLESGGFLHGKRPQCQRVG